MILPEQQNEQRLSSYNAFYGLICSFNSVLDKYILWLFHMTLFCDYLHEDN